MRYPSKICSLQDSIISKFSIILDILKEEDLSIHDLFNKSKKYLKNIDEYIEVLECLYTLGRIEYNSDTRRLHYAV